MAFRIEGDVLVEYIKEPGVTEVTVPEGVKSIGNEAFARCPLLTSITLPEGVRDIGEEAFFACTRLEQLTLPASLAKIGRDAFFYCGKLDRIILSPENPNFCLIDDALYTKGGKKLLLCPRKKESITLSESMTMVGALAFYACSDLTKITVPESNQKFCSVDGALYTKDGTKLICCPAKKRSLLLTENLTKIQKDAIDWRNLRAIKLRPDDPEIERVFPFCGLEKCLLKAMEMIRTGNYSLNFSLDVKYPFLILHYLHTKDENLAAYIKKNITKMMRTAISNDDLPFIQAVTQEDIFISRQSMENYIKQALDGKHQKAWAYLADYKHRHFGFEKKDSGLL